MGYAGRRGPWYGCWNDMGNGPVGMSNTRLAVKTSLALWANLPLSPVGSVPAGYVPLSLSLFPTDVSPSLVRTDVSLPLVRIEVSLLVCVPSTLPTV